MATVHNHPLAWYVDKLRSGEPFAYLSYGDGEFLVASGLAIGRKMAFGELVTQAFSAEMRASLDNADPRILRGTDRHLIFPETYHGGDAVPFRAMCAAWLGRLPDLRVLEWVDGVVWDRVAQDGKLWPLLEALRELRPTLVANRKLVEALKPILDPRAYRFIPETNAYGDIDAIAEWLTRPSYQPPKVFVLCMGLGASPLTCRLLAKHPDATFIDLGSSLDLFARIGVNRGWRAELYADEAKYRDLVRRNLEGTC